MSSHFTTAANRIRRSPYQTLAAVSIMTMTLFLACAFFLIAAGSQAVLKYFETRPQVNAFFATDFTPSASQVEIIKSDLAATGTTDSITYISKEDALTIYKELNKNDPLLLEAVTAQMLPASIEVTAVNPSDLKPLADRLKEVEGISDVRYAEDVVGQLSKWTASVRAIGIALVGAHVFITFTIIMLIIGVKVANRREEISLLQLVGATPGYVAAPFIWEGLLYGLSGAFIAWGVSYLVLLYSTGFLIGFLTGVPILPVPVIFMLEVLAGTIALGALVGGLGGFLAVRRYLKA
ncbi:MAG: cell division transport system permease protein [Microgenomates group bacterium Gr01-1014_16]|nr:MAG: cell division transport system permease protein [Microgenomates group bacterium Gr01-1014_16]